MKKGLESGLQASLPSIFQPPFSIRFADADDCIVRPAASLCGSARGGFIIAPPQRRTLPLVFAAAKTASPFEQVNKAAVRRALPCGFAKQTEKDGEDLGSELARIPEILRLFQLTAAKKETPNNRNDWFFVTFLTQESNVSPSLIACIPLPFSAAIRGLVPIA